MGYLTKADYDSKVKLCKVDVEFSKIIVKYIGIYYYIYGLWILSWILVYGYLWQNEIISVNTVNSFILNWKKLLFVKVVILLHIKNHRAWSYLWVECSVSEFLLLKRLSDPWLFFLLVLYLYFSHYCWSVCDSLKLFSDEIRKEFFLGFIVWIYLFFKYKILVNFSAAF